ncbi:MAG: uncharacterized protein QOD06_2212 [Candidatus Binatota bacterium]|nr:uncharacterized protein [Candidatus Binatota bacterium]
MSARYPNRLGKETSPYLLQHALNPVDWHPWGPEAFATARRESKPILLSVGYSACHWCHVMERESFEDEETARLMNELFVNVKVDREERPDVDEVYMSCVQLLTGRGGWPMTVFLTPDGEPFYGGTYFPPEDRYGMPGFRKVLAGVAQTYRERPDDVKNAVARLTEALRQTDRAKPSERALEGSVVDRAADALAASYDRTNGGLGRAPKFPNVPVFSLFLRALHRTGRVFFLQMTTHTLRKMADGGIYDQLGGGFHRYSVDERWLVPHFEKMLYDNAQLVRLYLDTYRASQDPFFLAVAEDVLRYVRREMLAPEGGFYSTQDADSEGDEGKFFVWTKEEVMRLLGEECGEIFCRVYDVTEEGNFEHRNILHRTLATEQAARLFRKEPDELERILADGRSRLFAAREERVKPQRDEKILVSWNGLMVSAFADAYRATGNPEYRDVAERTIAFVEKHLWRDGRLLHSFKDGEARVPAFLDDFTALALAYVDLFEATFESRYLERADELARIVLVRFADREGGGFFYTAEDHERLITRTKPAFDGSVPSGNSLAAQLFLRLHHLSESPEYLQAAEGVLQLHRDAMEENPFAFANLLAALDFWARKPKEIVVVARGGAPAARELLDPLARHYVPNLVVYCYDPDAPPQNLPPFAREKSVADGATAYVCHEFTCSPPVTAWSELLSTIEARR